MQLCHGIEHISVTLKYRNNIFTLGVHFNDSLIVRKEEMDVTCPPEKCPSYLLYYLSI